MIDENGRAYTKHDTGIKLSYQDNGRTLKVFVQWATAYGDLPKGISSAEKDTSDIGTVDYKPRTPEVESICVEMWEYRYKRGVKDVQVRIDLWNKLADILSKYNISHKSIEPDGNAITTPSVDEIPYEEIEKLRLEMYERFDLKEAYPLTHLEDARIWRFHGLVHRVLNNPFKAHLSHTTGGELKP